MTDDPRSQDHWSADPGHRLTQIIDGITDTMEGIPGFADLRGFFVLYDSGGDSGAGAVGYDATPTADQVAEFVRAAQNLFAASGIRLDVAMSTEPPPAEEGPFPPVREESDPGQPRAELTIGHQPMDPRLAAISRAVKAAVEEQSDFRGSKVFIMVQPPDDDGQVVLHHGYEDLHELSHALLACFMRMHAEFGTATLVPVVMESPN